MTSLREWSSEQREQLQKGSSSLDLGKKPLEQIHSLEKKWQGCWNDEHTLVHPAFQSSMCSCHCKVAEGVG